MSIFEYLFDVPSAEDANITHAIHLEFSAASKSVWHHKGGTFDSAPRRGRALLFVSPEQPLTYEERKTLSVIAEEISVKHGGYKVKVVFK